MASIQQCKNSQKEYADEICGGRQRGQLQYQGRSEDSVLDHVVSQSANRDVGCFVPGLGLADHHKILGCQETICKC